MWSETAIWYGLASGVIGLGLSMLTYHWGRVDERRRHREDEEE